MPVDWPNSGVEIVDMTETRYAKNLPTGIAEISTFVTYTSSGASYATKEIVPRQEYDRTVEMTTPLGTRMRGYNSDLATLFARNRNRVRLYGFNRSADHPTPLAEDVLVYSLIRRHLNARQGHKPGERRAINYGQSRGGMGGLGIMACGNLLGEPVDLGIHVDDCLPDKTGAVKTLTGLPPQNMLRELWAVPQSARRHPNETRLQQGERVLRWAQSANPSPQFLRAQVHSGRALWSGAAGTFTPHLSTDQGIVLHSFNRNHLNGRNAYVERLQRFPFFRIIDEHKWHLDLARFEVIQGSANKLVAAQQAFQRGAAMEEIVDSLTQPFFPSK